MTVVVGGALAQRPGAGGHAWVFLNWLLGLRSLGHDVVFVDRLEPEMLTSGAALTESPQFRWLQRTLDDHGFGGSWAVLYDHGRTCVGMERDDLLARCRRASVLFNFMGYIDDPQVLDGVECRAYVDIDPGFPQMWCDLGLHDGLHGHDKFVTVGLNIGASDCTVPSCGREWVTMLPPVAVGHWPDTPLPTGATRLTSVCTWRGPYGTLEHRGVSYGPRAHELRRFADVPRRVPDASFELALAIDPADDADRSRLDDSGWSLVDPAVVARDPYAYRAYLQRSSAELLVAKGMYVRSRGGWVSDRSACYLASGRPVIAQDTGFTAHIPTGEGLLTFADPDGLVDAVDEVLGNPHRHAKAARALAVDFFEARKVLTRLLGELGIG